jgi:hypothetical protein
MDHGGAVSFCDRLCMAEMQTHAHHPKSTYNAYLFLTSEMALLQKTPRLSSETPALSPQETTARARVPKQNRRMRLPCMPSSSRVDPSLKSRAGGPASLFCVRNRSSIPYLLCTRFRPHSCGIRRHRDVVTHDDGGIASSMTSSHGGWATHALGMQPVVVQLLVRLGAQQTGIEQKCCTAGCR